jgi:hypothetical protein
MDTLAIGAFLIGASFLALVVSAFVQAWYAR